MLRGEIRSSKEKKEEKIKIRGEESGHSCIGQVRSSDGFVLLGDHGHAR